MLIFSSDPSSITCIRQHIHPKWSYWLSRFMLLMKLIVFFVYRSKHVMMKFERFNRILIMLNVINKTCLNVFEWKPNQRKCRKRKIPKDEGIRFTYIWSYVLYEIFSDINYNWISIWLGKNYKKINKNIKRLNQNYVKINGDMKQGNWKYIDKRF